jgi:hypothetical protein
MGALGPKIFDDDMACDVRAIYTQLIEDGTDDSDAQGRILELYSQCLEDPETATSVLVALAVTQSKIGRLDPTIRDRAVALIDQGGDLHVWEDESPKFVSARKAALEKARAQLLGPQPKRKRLKPPAKLISGLAAGDVLAFDLPDGPLIFRIVAIKTTRYGESPIVQALDYRGPTVPSVEVMQSLTPIVVFGLRHFSISISQDVPDWKQAGFRKAAKVSILAADQPSSRDTTVFTWDSVAKFFSEREFMDSHE